MEMEMESVQRRSSTSTNNHSRICMLTIVLLSSWYSIWFSTFALRDIFATYASPLQSSSENDNGNEMDRCGQIYFWGGGKAGSSSLWFTLMRGPGGKGNPRNNGPFPRRITKEPCRGKGKQWQKWVNLTQDTQLCNNKRGTSTATGVTNENGEGIDMGMRYTHIINGCPRETSVSYAKAIMAMTEEGRTSHPTFLMLVRDPVDRLVSLLNDQVRRGGSRIDIQEVAAKAAKHNPLRIASRELFYQGKALQNLLSVVKDRHKILIIPMESMTVDSQGVIDAVMDHIGGERWTFNTTDEMSINKGEGNKGYKYVTLPKKTTEALRDVLREDVLLLERLVGKRFTWSSWARKETEHDEGDYADWLVTTPIPETEGYNSPKK